MAFKIVSPFGSEMFIFFSGDKVILSVFCVGYLVFSGRLLVETICKGVKGIYLYFDSWFSAAVVRNLLSLAGSVAFCGRCAIGSDLEAICMSIFCIVASPEAGR